MELLFLVIGIALGGAGALGILITYDQHLDAKRDAEMWSEDRDGLIHLGKVVSPGTLRPKRAGRGPRDIRHGSLDDEPLDQVYAPGLQ